MTNLSSLVSLPVCLPFLHLHRSPTTTIMTTTTAQMAAVITIGLSGSGIPSEENKMYIRVMNVSTGTDEFKAHTKKN